MFAWRAYRELAQRLEETDRMQTAVLDRLRSSLDRNAVVMEEMRVAMRANSEALRRLVEMLERGDRPT